MISRADIIASANEVPDRMLAPSAYSESMLPALRLARSSQFARRLGKLVLMGLILGLGFVAIAPWQQSVSGAGSVIAFAPGERPQTIEAPIKGRIARWGENVFENARVKKGDVIAEIEDVDPNLMTRLESQLTATQRQVDAAKLLLEATERNRDAARKIIASQEALLRTYESGKEQILLSADAAIAGAQNKVDAERKQLEEFQAALTQIDADFRRQKELWELDLVAEVKFQMAERKALEATAKVEKAKEYVKSAQNGMTSKQRDRDAKEQKAQGDIDYATALLDKAKGDVAKSESDVAKATSELRKSEKMLLEMETKVQRQRSQSVEAPFDGFLTKINANLGGQMIKEGDTLCVIVPETTDRAIEVLLDGNDAPLVEPGRHVRIQFEGWPAVQFAGWPSVAVGTFGGEVVSVDATDNGKGKFRALVRPAADSPEWPNERYLRQGVRTNAWVLLEQVPLWYEIWRNMNGFPPVVTQTGEEKSKSKPPKLPK